ncbi:MAG: hypothetical protein ACYC7D_09090 [Nitrososphaerales archaeon]
MSNRNTVVRAIRIDNGLDRAIIAAAEEKGLSFNLLASQILTKYTEFDRVAEKLGFVSFAPIGLKNLLNLISNEESERLGSLSGFSGQNAKQFANILVGRSDLQGFLDTLKLMEKYIRAFSTEISVKDSDYRIIMSHTMGIKWSCFLKGMVLTTLEIYGLKPEFEITENFMTTKFSTATKLEAASSTMV